MASAHGCSSSTVLVPISLYCGKYPLQQGQVRGALIGTDMAAGIENGFGTPAQIPPAFGVCVEVSRPKLGKAPERQLRRWTVGAIGDCSPRRPEECRIEVFVGIRRQVGKGLQPTGDRRIGNVTTSSPPAQVVETNARKPRSQGHSQRPAQRPHLGPRVDGADGTQHSRVFLPLRRAAEQKDQKAN